MSHVWHADTTNPHRPKASVEAFFSYGFRPFFLGAAVYAAVVMTVWLAWVATAGAGTSPQWLPVAGSPYAWHAHEMVFGFAVAAIAGFLLTAVPNWTGSLPLSGPPLALLFHTWLAGRVAMGLSGLLPGWLVSTIDLSFLPLLGAFAARQLFVKPAARNLVFLALLAAMTLGNAAFHLGTYDVLALDPVAAIRSGLLVVTIMVAIIGGRIIPAFTHNWLHLKAGRGPLPRRFRWLDTASIVAIVAFAVLRASGVSEPLAGSAALIAAALNGTRLCLWRGWAARSEPIVWVLHLGYAWIVVGLLVNAAASLTSSVPGALASHAFGTGAIGTMILAVMSRASLGHTGRPLVAPPAIVGAYLLVTLAALLRVAGPLFAPQHPTIVLGTAALAWIAAFTLFALVYAPILTTPRVHTKSRPS